MQAPPLFDARPGSQVSEVTFQSDKAMFPISQGIHGAVFLWYNGTSR